MGIAEDFGKLTEGILAARGARAQDMETMTQETRAFAENTRAMLRGISAKQKDRAAFLRARLEKNAADVETSVRKKLQAYSAAHAETSDALRQDLAKYAAGISQGTQELLAGFHAERGKMGAHWQALAAAKGLKRGIPPGPGPAGAGRKTGQKPPLGKRGRKSGLRD